MGFEWGNKDPKTILIDVDGLFNIRSENKWQKTARIKLERPQVL